LKTGQLVSVASETPCLRVRSAAPARPRAPSAPRWSALPWTVLGSKGRTPNPPGGKGSRAQPTKGDRAARLRRREGV